MLTEPKYSRDAVFRLIAACEGLTHLTIPSLVL